MSCNAYSMLGCERRSLPKKKLDTLLPSLLSAQLWHLPKDHTRAVTERNLLSSYSNDKNVFLRAQGTYYHSQSVIALRNVGVFIMVYQGEYTRPYPKSSLSF